MEKLNSAMKSSKICGDYEYQAGKFVKKQKTCYES